MSTELSEHLGVGIDRVGAVALVANLNAVHACPYCILRYLKVEMRRWYTASCKVRSLFPLCPRLARYALSRLPRPSRSVLKLLTYSRK